MTIACWDRPGQRSWQFFRGSSGFAGPDDLQRLAAPEGNDDHETGRGGRLGRLRAVAAAASRAGPVRFGIPGAYGGGVLAGYDVARVGATSLSVDQGEYGGRDEFGALLVNEVPGSFRLDEPADFGH